MPQVAAIITLALDGETPAALGLAPLRACASSIRTFREALHPYSVADAAAMHLNDGPSATAAVNGPELVAVYVVGHAWLGGNGQGFMGAYRGADGVSVPLTGAALVDLLNASVGEASDLLLVLDTCHAGAATAAFRRLRGRSVTVVYASAADESAWELRFDGATRLAHEWARQLGRRRLAIRRTALPRELRVLAAVDRIAEAIDHDHLMNHQTVSAEVVRGSNPVLTRAPRAGLRAARKRTRRFIVMGLLTVGVALATTVFLLRDRWYDGTWVVVDLGEAGTVVDSATIRVYEVRPEHNDRVLVDSFAVAASDRSIRRWLSARNLLVVFDATYLDREPREVRFHRVVAPSWFAEKWLTLRLPPAAELSAHPRMAYVGPATWFGGERVERRGPLPAYWIDIRPPTVREYLPFLVAAIRDGRLEPLDSMIASDWLDRIDVPGEDLKTPAGIAATLSGTPPTGSLAAEPECPASMTYAEAKLFTAAAGKRLPTPAEWELAVRGADGRTFPWGHSIDRERVNAGLPREVGSENRTRLRPSKKFDTESPLGLVDTVGNAGDWADEAGVPLIMGGCYNQNAEDCTTFASMGIPSSDMDTFAAVRLWKVTCRGVAPVAPAP